MDKISVLLVDDHPLFRQGLRDVLRSEPDIAVVGEGADGNEALELARKLNLRRTPLLSFHRDDSIEEAARVLQLMGQVEEEDTR